jgi:hypothetical protein
VGVAGPLRAAPAEDDLRSTLASRAEREPDALRGDLRRLLDDEASLDDARTERLLLAAAALGEVEMLDVALEAARPRLAKAPDRVRGAFGTALLRRARLEEPPDGALLREAAAALAFAAERGSAPEALDLAYARHLAGDVAGARAGYERALGGSEATAERALAGIESLLGGDSRALDAQSAALLARHPSSAAVARRRADALARAGLVAEAARTLEAFPSPTARLRVDLARHLRALGREDEATALERDAVEDAGADPAVAGAAWQAWRARRLETFADYRTLEEDARRLLAKAPEGPRPRWARATLLNDLGFLLREGVSVWTWRGEARTQGLVEGAPKEARALLDRCLAVYDEAVAEIGPPPVAEERPFGERWVYAGILNDAALVRHYFVDVRDLEKAEALYRRAFEMTDGAYMDTYFYNLQYLYGFELPGREETWLRLARRASERILLEADDGTLVPDERKRDAARRDARALLALLEERERAGR